MAAHGDRLDPAVARARPAEWHAWLAARAETRSTPLRALGVALGLGFGAAVLALWGFADLADEVAGGDTAGFDAQLLAWLQQVHSPLLTWAAKGFALFGSELVYVLAGVAGIVLGRQGRWGAVVSLLLVTGGAILLTEILKHLFERDRPDPAQALLTVAGYSFPSGHAMVAAAFYVFLAYLIWRVVPGKRRWGYTAGLLSLVLLIGWARLYLGVHYPSDVAAGYLAGFLWTDAVILGGYLLGRPSTQRPVAR